MKNYFSKERFLSLCLVIIIALSVYRIDLCTTPTVPENSTVYQTSSIPFSAEDIPQYSGSPYVVVNNNEPFFADDEMTSEVFEHYSNLDELGRCGTAVASIGVELMPTEERESISHIEPTGWVSIRYDHIDGGYLYNRCHLLGFQLSGENANERNLITGTRAMNVEAMLPFENLIADYVKETENHVYYRVTPIFFEYNLLASGVLMEAKSIEDIGNGVQFNVFCYNVQDGVTIDYATGNSEFSQVAFRENSDSPASQDEKYILNINTKKIHLNNCRYVEQIYDENKLESDNELEELFDQGFESCKVCLE